MTNTWAERLALAYVADVERLIKQERSLFEPPETRTPERIRQRAAWDLYRARVQHRRVRR